MQAEILTPNRNMSLINAHVDNNSEHIKTAVVFEDPEFSIVDFAVDSKGKEIIEAIYGRKVFYIDPEKKKNAYRAGQSDDDEPRLKRWFQRVLS